MYKLKLKKIRQLENNRSSEFVDMPSFPCIGTTFQRLCDGTPLLPFVGMYLNQEKEFIVPVFLKMSMSVGHIELLRKREEAVEFIDIWYALLSANLIGLLATGVVPGLELQTVGLLVHFPR